jgi:hypothetical protein
MDAPPNTTFAEPIPYGIANNDNDVGWIWPSDNSGLLNVDFGLPAMLTGFRAYVTYGGGQRGANWAIEYSDDQATWTLATDFHFLTTLGGGINDDFTHRTDYGGWYEVTFNPGATIAARYWRVRQTEVLANHAPRCGQVEFYGTLLCAPARDLDHAFRPPEFPRAAPPPGYRGCRPHSLWHPQQHRGRRLDLVAGGRPPG